MGDFFGCCASAITATTCSTTATRIDGKPNLFIAHPVLGVMYHADGDKGKSRLVGLSRRRNQFNPGIAACFSAII
jgi:hypothetical protein